ncbi:hypothetical protein, partial [Cylindrospermopsis raciborskii]|uniref:hypothetical protein n=1 Tax=Cylindrospermopsis raciborskii TaxID=77022 RepID=UPI0038CFB486
MKKYLIIKNLILEKLDIITALSQQSAQKFQETQDNTNKKFQETQEAIDTILENQVFLLKSSLDTVQALHKSIATSESALTDLTLTIGRIDQLVGDSYSLVEQAYQKLSLPLADTLELNQNQKV